MSGFILGSFGKNEKTAQNNYRDFVEKLDLEDYESPLKNVHVGPVLGSPDFIEEISETHLKERGEDKDTRVIQKETKVLLGQPANYPSEMVSALTTLLAKHSAVKAAYLCLMHDPSSDEKPSIVVGFDGDKDLSEAMKEAGSVAVDTAPKGELVDFVALKKGESGISDYMYKSVKPFYERTWGSKLVSLFSPGRA